MQQKSSRSASKTAILPAIGVLLMVAVFAPDFAGGQFQFKDFIPLTLSSAGLAWLFSVQGWAIGFLATVAAYLVRYLTTSSPFFALGALMILPFALAFTFVAKQKLSRAVAVTVSATGMLMFLLLSILLPVVITQGSLTLNAIKTYHGAFIESLHQALRESFTVNVAGKDVPFFTSHNAEGYVNLILALFPGIMALYTVIVSLVGSGLFRLFSRLSHHPLPENTVWRIRPIGVTGIYTLLAVLLTAFLPTDSLIWLTTANLCLMLLPYFFVAGVSSAFEPRIVNGKIRPRFLRSFTLFFSIFFGIFGPIVVSLVFGLYDSILTLFPKRKNRQQS